MDNKVEKRIKESLSIVFKVPVDVIDENTSPHTLKGWDSLNHIKMILALEDEFCIELDPTEIEAMISFDIIRATISAYID